MDNHIHMCLYYKDINDVSKFMHIINSKFANYYNFLENRVGYVFRSRFFLQEIVDRQQLYNVIAYIHNNPKKANLIEELEKYQYSSYKDYINKKVDNEILLLVFETLEYKKIFNFIHKNYKVLDVKDIVEEKKYNYEEIINNFLIKNKISIDIVKKENNLLLELIELLKIESGITNKKISEILGVNKNRVTRIYRKIMM